MGLHYLDSEEVSGAVAKQRLEFCGYLLRSVAPG
jgi:hypothetical protein